MAAEVAVETAGSPLARIGNASLLKVDSFIGGAWEKTSAKKYEVWLVLATV
jgi:hypothetical protein